MTGRLASPRSRAIGHPLSPMKRKNDRSGKNKEAQKMTMTGVMAQPVQGL